MELTQAQIDERVAVLRRFRELLEAQRDKFREYLAVLEKHSGTIESENTEAILAHTELEQHIVENIVTLQKVITPIENLYSRLDADQCRDDAKISQIQGELEHLQRQVLKLNEQNRSLLKSHLAQIQSRIAEIQNPYRNLKSVYAAVTPEQIASFIQVDV